MNQSLVDTEKLLALLNEPTEVNDRPNAPDLLVKDGEIEFGKSLFHSYHAQSDNDQIMSISRMMGEVRPSMASRSKFRKVPLWH